MAKKAESVPPPEEETLCGDCHPPKPATKFCVRCSRALCEPCAKAHPQATTLQA